jgi:proteic killer suppression protein
MIVSFRNRGLREFFEHENPRRLSVQNPKRIRRILLALDAAARPEDMSVPGFGFHPLKGKDAGRYAVDASGNWRVTFGWSDQNAVDVDLEDYHR